MQQAATEHDNKQAQRQEEIPQPRRWRLRAAGSGCAWHHASSQRQQKAGCVMQQQHNRGCGFREIPWQPHGGNQKDIGKTFRCESCTTAGNRPVMHCPGRSQMPNICTFQRHLQHSKLAAELWLQTQRGESAEAQPAAPLWLWLYARSTQLQCSCTAARETGRGSLPCIPAASLPKTSTPIRWHS